MQIQSKVKQKKPVSMPHVLYFHFFHHHHSFPHVVSSNSLPLLLSAHPSLALDLKNWGHLWPGSWGLAWSWKRWTLKGYGWQYSTILWSTYPMERPKLTVIYSHYSISQWFQTSFAGPWLSASEQQLFVPTKLIEMATNNRNRVFVSAVDY